MTFHSSEAGHLRDFLLQIYRCPEPFTLSISPHKPRRYMGLYHASRRHITVYAGWCDSVDDLKETAIHEYAHHICHTRLGDRPRQVHDECFWQIYAALVTRAAEKCLYRPHSMPVLREIMAG